MDGQYQGSSASKCSRSQGGDGLIAWVQGVSLLLSITKWFEMNELTVDQNARGRVRNVDAAY